MVSDWAEKMSISRFNPRETVVIQNVNCSCPIMVIAARHAKALILC